MAWVVAAAVATVAAAGAALLVVRRGRGPGAVTGDAELFAAPAVPHGRVPAPEDSSRR